MSKKRRNPSPCLRCTRVKNPRACDNKQCEPWRAWFLERWALIHAYPRQQMELTEQRPEGENIGGTLYAPPHRVREYLQKDPCEHCVCPKELCTTPCRVRRAWEDAKGDQFL